MLGSTNLDYLAANPHTYTEFKQIKERECDFTNSNSVGIAE